jgi:riboflavin biosynthesis pyrimidine reductase
MKTQAEGATDMATEIAGEATRESVQTDLQPNDGTASGGETVRPDSALGTVTPPLPEIELPGPVYEIDEA